MPIDLEISKIVGFIIIPTMTASVTVYIANWHFKKDTKKQYLLAKDKVANDLIISISNMLISMWALAHIHRNIDSVRRKGVKSLFLTTPSFKKLNRSVTFYFLIENSDNGQIHQILSVDLSRDAVAPTFYIEGKSGDDSLVGLAGQDTIYGGIGNDLIRGDYPGRLPEPSEYGGANINPVWIETGESDLLYGGSGRDLVWWEW